MCHMNEMAHCIRTSYVLVFPRIAVVVRGNNPDVAAEGGTAIALRVLKS